MRTTLTINDDVLVVARGSASRQNKSLGEVISTLSRQALRPTGTGRKPRNGVPLRRVRAGTAPVTLELVNELRDALS